MEEFVGVNFRIGGEDGLASAMNNIARSVSQFTKAVETLHARMGATVRGEAKKTEAAHLTAEQAKKRATEAAIRDDNRLIVKLARDQIQTLSDTVRAHEKAEKEKSAATKREASERTRAEVKATKEATKAANERQSGKRAIASGAAGGFRSGVGTIASGAGIVTGAIGTAGIVSGVEDEMQLRSRLSALSVSTREPGKAGIDVEATRKQIRQIAGETGIKATDIAESLNVASEHGTGLPGVQAFQANLPMFAKLALATDTRIQDVAENSATLTSAGVTDPKEQSRVIRALASAAKSGNIAMKELGNLVAVGAGGATSGQFQGTASDRVLQSSALMQMARTSGDPNAENAATGVKNFYNDIEKKRLDLEALGVKTFTKDENGKKVRRDAVAQYIDAIAASKGDPTKLEGILGMQSKGVGTALLRSFKEGYEVEPGRKIYGAEAVRAQVGGLMSNAMSEGDVAADAATRLADTSTKVAASMERFKAKVGEDMIKVLDRNIDQFNSLAGAVTKSVEVFVNHPVAVAAAFLGLKTAMGGLGTWIGSLVSKKLFAPIANVQATVVNVSGGIPGTGGGVPGLPGGTPAAPVAGGGIGGWLGGAVAANPIGVGVAVGSAVGYGAHKLNEHLLQSNPGYKKFWDESGWVNDPNSTLGADKSYMSAPLVGRNKMGRVMTIDSATREWAAASLGFSSTGPASAPSLAGSRLDVPNMAPVELAADTKIGLDRASTEAIGESFVSAWKRANDNKSSTSIADRMLSK